MARFIIFMLLLSFVNLEAQQLYLDIGKTSSSFSYTDSSGDALDNLLPKSHTYMRLGYRDFINNDKTFFFSVGGMYSGYGAIASDRVLNNYYEWDVTYLGLEAGLDYRLFRLRDFSFYLKSSVASEFLIQGTQTINNQVYNLVDEEEFNSYNFFVRGGLLITYPISRNTFITANYTYGFTTQLNSGNANDKEKLNFNAHQFGFGFIINLPNCNCSY